MSKPNSIEPLHRLFEYIVWLYVRWQTQKDLFGHSEDRVKLLNRHTGYAFRILQDAMLENILVEIAKLFDKASVCGKETLTFAGILRDEIPASDPRRFKLQADLKSLKQRCEPILSHRHRRLAHNEKSVALEQEVLPGVTRTMIGEAIDGLTQLYNDIALAMNKPQMAFDYLKEDRAVDALVRVLEAGNDKLDADAAARGERYR